MDHNQIVEWYLRERSQACSSQAQDVKWERLCARGYSSQTNTGGIRMNLKFSADEEAFRQEVRDFIKKEVPSDFRGADTDCQYEEEAIDEIVWFVRYIQDFSRINRLNSLNGFYRNC